MENKKIRNFIYIVLITLFAIKASQNIQIWQTRESLWTNTIKYTPQSTMATANLGLMEYTSGDKSKGTEMLEKAVSYNPNNFFARKKLAYLYLDQKNVEAAIKQYNILIERNPDKNTAFKTVGDIFNKEGYLDIAQQYYQKIIK
jgi:tetratricopeptide (TPR) repeat protein